MSVRQCDELQPNATNIAKVPTPQPTKTRIVFDKDGLSTQVPAAEAPVSTKTTLNDDETGSDDEDDDAPEVVSTSKVASQFKKSAQQAQRLVYE